MFLVVARQSRNSQLLMLMWPGKYAGSWEGTQPGQLTQTGQRDILFIWCHAQYISWGSWPGATIAALGQAGYCSWGGRQLHYASLVLYYYYHHHLCLCFPSKLSLSQPMTFYFFPFSFPSHGGGVTREWVSSSLVLGCWLPG